MRIGLPLVSGKRRHVGLCALLAFSPAGFAAVGETLSEAWSMAAQRDPGLAAVLEQSAAAIFDERAARAARLPSLSVGGAYSKFEQAPRLDVDGGGFRFTSPPIFDRDDVVTGFAELKLPLYAGGGIDAAVKAAKAGRRAAEAEQLLALSALKMDVAAAYLDVQRSKRSERAAHAQVLALEAHLADVEAMVAAELRARSDLLATKVALATARQSAVRASNAVSLALGAYNRRLGQPLDRAVELADAMPMIEDIASESLAQLQARALQQRAERSALLAKAAGFAEQARAQLARTLPQLALVAGYNRLENAILDREDFSMVGVGVQWSLFDGGQARARAASLRRAERAMTLRGDELDSLIRLDVQQALLGVAEAEARFALGREAVAEAQENLRISRELYTAELITNTQVLEATALQLAASAQADEADFDRLLARLNLLRAVGDL